MAIFIALLRGINVGKAKRLPMAELRALLEALGYTDVSTLLNSGNAVFRTAKGTPASHAKLITAAIEVRMGFDVPVVVKSAKELAATIAENPLAAAAPNHSQLLTVFAQDNKSLAGLSTIATLVQPPEQFVVGAIAAYLDCAAGILESKAGEALLGKAGKSVTTRNWATVLKLQALVEATEA
jgi:uncharacterized protein (DUF1697 family)